MDHPDWVTFEDDSAACRPPDATASAGVPKPNVLKLTLPAMHDLPGSSLLCGSPLTSPLLFSNGGPCVPSNTPLCTPTPQPTGPQCLFSSVGPSPFPAFQDNSGHSNPFWSDGRRSGSSSSDSDSGVPRFSIRKDGPEPPGDPIQRSYTYLCQKLESLRAEEDEEPGGTAPVQRSQESGGPSFIPRGLFRSQSRDGWHLMLRIPEKKNRMSSRQWGPIYLRLRPGGVLQMFYERGLESPFKELQLHPYCRLSPPKLESCSELGKIHTVKIEHAAYAERRRYHPKAEVVHEVQELEQLLKFGTTDHADFSDLLATVEEELLRLPPHSQQRRHYEEQELQLHIQDSFWARLGTDGTLLERAALTQVYCLAFVNSPAECFLALNDLQLLRRDPSYGPEEGEAWMEIGDCFFHKSVNEDEFRRSRLVRFTPPDACRVELMRFKTLSVAAELPFSVKAVVTVQGAYVELQVFLSMSPAFAVCGPPDPGQVCDNVVLQVSVPGDWVKVSRTVALLRQKSLKARMNRNACLGSVGAADTEPVMQVTVGAVKYESAFGAIVWRVERLPTKNTAPDQPHCLSCKLELGSDQEIPDDWRPFVTVEFDVAEAAVSGTRVKSLGTESDIQPQKHIVSKAHYHCQVQIEKKWIQSYEGDSRRRADCLTQ
ncbi:STON1 protein, partial [Amia calva]|nr:STON1 protein [Amia calva]